VHGIHRASTPEFRQRRRDFIDELKRHVPVHAVTDATGELMGKVSGEQAAKGIRLPFDDLAIGHRPWSKATAWRRSTRATSK